MSFLEQIKQRRSIYSIGKNVSLEQDKIEEIIGVENIYKGERDGEDLSYFKDETIESRLRNKIYDSSLTIVLISKNMNDRSKNESDQWIPWEVSYSLKETSRKNKSGESVTSRSNAMLAVVLPDGDNSYTYYFESKSCCNGGCTTHHTDKLFEIIRKNKFNNLYLFEHVQ